MTKLLSLNLWLDSPPLYAIMTTSSTHVVEVDREYTYLI